MTRRRWPLVGLLLACWLVAGCGADDGGQAAGTTTTATSASTSTTVGATTSTAATTTAGFSGTLIEVRVTGDEVETANRRVRVDRGEKVRIRVEADRAEEVHLHGYDLSADVAPGQARGDRLHRRRRRRVRGRARGGQAAAVRAPGSVTTGGVLAHGIGGRSDLPVPLWLAQYGAAAALLVSFTVLALFWRTPRLEGPAARDGRPLPDGLRRFADARATRVGLRAVGLLMAVLTVVVAAFGPNNSGTNPAPTWVYVWFWVGLVPASLLLGPVWRLLNPLRTISAGLARLAGDPGQAHARPLPPGLGYWPAAISLVVFAWLELVYPYRDEPYTLLVFILLYAWAQLVAAFRYGQAWYARRRRLRGLLDPGRLPVPDRPAHRRPAELRNPWPAWPPSGRRPGCWR